ncbi:hypothetical protein [Lichenifustis flavocetrariae]|uniref:Uncharacterized protein n=1 Tax=Lichenifustis flavocetrariae TaxID=2949735 RepID=A0AA42CLQ1_9HYPH|nr:hypothetical protein [Lichenifustis flavocetrariae]MCW6511793.1 hypothetical protein [Lichenifustis flavocetrariae]
MFLQDVLGILARMDEAVQTVAGAGRGANGRVAIGIKERIAELRAIKSQAEADAERAAAEADTIGPEITPATLTAFAAAARRKLRGPDGRFRRDHLRALAQRVEVADREVRIMGSRSELLRQLAIANGVATAAGGVPRSVPSWGTVQDEAGHHAYAIPL